MFFSPNYSLLVFLWSVFKQISYSTANNNVILLDRGNKTTCTVNLFGATVTSWKVNDKEQIFLSSKAIFDGKTAIRGGVPIVFPKFGKWGYGPNHGFARVSNWKLEKGPKKTPTGDIEAEFSLEESEHAKEWVFKFRLQYVLILRESELYFDMKIHNDEDEKPFIFNILFHTYFKVPDIKKCSISGLQGSKIIDKLKLGEAQLEASENETVHWWTDKIYQNTHEMEHILKTSDRTISIKKVNLPDTVVWNPWDTGSKEIKDLRSDEWNHMICIEPGSVVKEQEVKARTSFWAAQTLHLESTTNVSETPMQFHMNYFLIFPALPAIVYWMKIL